MENTTKLLETVNVATCKEVRIQFDPESAPGAIMRDLKLSYGHNSMCLERALLKFSQIGITWNIKRPLRATKNLFWTQELKKHFTMLSKRGIMLALKSKTGESFEFLYFQFVIATDKLMAYAVFPAGHDGSVSDLVVSPDSKWIASGSLDSTVILWDTCNGGIAQQWALPNYPAVCSFAFSPDSRYLVCGSQDGGAAVWDLAEVAACMVGVFQELGHPVTGCAWSPDGALIATASSEEPMKVWDASTFNLVFSVKEKGVTEFSPNPLHLIPLVTFSPDGRWLASACSTSGYCCIRDIPQGTERRVGTALEPYDFKARSAAAVYSVSPAFDSGSKRLVTTPQQYEIKIWDMAEGEEILIGHCRGFLIHAASFSPDGNALLVVTQGLLRVLDLDSGVVLLELEGYSGVFDGIRDAQFSPCGQYIAATGKDNMVFLWRTSDGTCIAEFSEHRDSVTHVRFSPDGKTLSSAAQDGTVVIRHMSDIIPVNQDP